MSKKSTGLQSWGEINIPSASKLGQHSEKQIFIWRIPVSAPRLNASVFGRSQGGEMAPTFLLYQGCTRHMDWEMFWTSLAGDEFVVGQMVLNCWKNISPAYISCTNTGKIRTCPWQERGNEIPHNDFGSLGIHKELTRLEGKFQQPQSRGGHSFVLHPVGREWPKPWSPGILSATNSKIQTESQKEWKMMGFVDNRHSPQGTVAVSELFPVGWEGLGTFEECGEQNYPNKHLVWTVLKNKTELKETSGFFISPKHVFTETQNGLGSMRP